MKICYPNQPADAKTMSRQGESAFTMVEIAIAIGVIGFALVAIIGILPAGMTAQKDQREDTIISQDAPYFLDAIRNGMPVNGDGTIGAQIYRTNQSAGTSLDFLTNYVQSIMFVINNNNNFTTNEIYASTNLFPNNLFSGAQIIGLLSTPQTNYNAPDFASNNFDTIATVRALSGPATSQQTGANTGVSSLMAFTYQMEVMITPFNSFGPDSTNYAGYDYPNADTNQFLIRSNRWREAVFNGPQFYSPYFNANMNTGSLQNNLFEVRLRFSWPVQNGSVGSHHQTYRTLVASQIVPAQINALSNYWYFQPQSYSFTPPPGL